MTRLTARVVENLSSFQGSLHPSEDVVIEVAFSSLPEEIELEGGVNTTFQEEMLLDEEGHLRIRKTFPCDSPGKCDIALVTYDFEDGQFAGLAVLKEKEINERSTSVGLETSKSGRGITNKGKRTALRAKAREEGGRLILRQLPVAKAEIWKSIEPLLPGFVLFAADTRLGVGETTFQSQFRPIVRTAADQPDVLDARDVFMGAIGKGLQCEIDQIFDRLRRHTDAFVGLTAKPDFNWDKAVSFDIVGRDRHSVEVSLERRGSGMRRLLMVAFFQYLAERGHEQGENLVLAVEEPENCLHPGLQRELAASFRQLADRGSQVIVTSHSPVFAGASPVEDLSLVVREAGVSRALQTPALDLSDVADQLGVEPSDQITGYSACVFVEGQSDIEFLKAVATTLKKAGHVNADFDDRRIGFVLCGGENLKHWIDLRAMGRLNRRFGVVVDSDRESPVHNIPGRKLNWKKQCEEQCGLFFILRKREIENYLHDAAIVRSGLSWQAHDDFTDMKKVFGSQVYKLIGEMTCEEIQYMDRYEEGGTEHHELVEIVQAFLELAGAC